jgi:hypothetical protein
MRNSHIHSSSLMPTPSGHMTPGSHIMQIALMKGGGPEL